MKTRLLTAVAAVSLIVLVGACSSSSSDAGNSATDGSKQVTQPNGGEKLPPGETEECEALMTFTASIGILQGDSGAGSIMNNSLTSDDVDGYFAPVKKVLDNLPPELQQAYPVLDKAAHASVGPDLDDAAVHAVWADPDIGDALVTMVDSTRSLCGLPETWMQGKY